MLAVPAGGLALVRRFDGLYGQDAYAYFDYATQSVRQSILHVAPLEPFFWPPAYPILVAVTSLVIGEQPLAGQLVSLTLGALVPVLTALLTIVLWPMQRWTAILAGLLVAVCGQLWQSSVVVMADTAGLALATFGALALAQYTCNRPCVRWLLGASAALACATLARWIYALVAVPFGAYALYVLIQRRAPLHGVLAALVGGVILLPVLGPPLIGLLIHPADPAPFAGNLQVYSWSPLNALRRDFPDTPDGHLTYALPNGVYYALVPGNLAYFGPLLAPWIIVGLWVAVREWPRPTLLLVVGWVASVYAFHAGAPWQNFRFSLAYLPPLAILIAAGLRFAWVRAVELVWVRGALLVYVGLGLVLMVGGGVRLMQTFIDRKDDELALVRWVDNQQASPGAKLLTFGPTLAFRHYSHLSDVEDLFELDPTSLSSIVYSSEPVYVLVDETSIDQQWRDRAPGRNLQILSASTVMERLGTFGAYTLFRVGGV